MSNSPTTTNGCILIGDFVENGNPEDHVAVSIGESVPTILAGDFVENATEVLTEREFKVLLRDHRIVNVIGRALKYFDESESSSQSGTYAVVGTDDDHSALIALFPVSQVMGIFCGKIELPNGARPGNSSKSKRATPKFAKRTAKLPRGVAKVKPRSRKR